MTFRDEGFAIEALLGRIKVPPPQHPESLLAKHEASLTQELRQLLASAPNHRDPMVQRRILPHCQPYIEAISYRMAYDAAVKAEVDPRLIDMFVAGVIKMDPAWYAENGIKRSEQAAMEESAAFELLPDLPKLMEELDVEEYITAPIASDGAWESFVSSLPTLKSPGGVAYKSTLVSRL